MADRRAPGRPLVGAGIVTVGAAVTIVGSAMPWLYGGTRSRTSYEVFPLIDRLGFAPGGLVAWAIRLWPLVPMLAVLTTVLAWWCLRTCAARWPLLMSAAVTAAYTGGVGVVVARADERAMIRVGDGPVVIVVGASLLIVGAAVTALSAGAERDDGERTLRRASRRARSAPHAGPLGGPS